MKVQGIACDFTAEHFAGKVCELLVISVKTDGEHKQQSSRNQQEPEDKRTFVFKHRLPTIIFVVLQVCRAVERNVFFSENKLLRTDIITGGEGTEVGETPKKPWFDWKKLQSITKFLIFIYKSKECDIIQADAMNQTPAGQAFGMAEKV